MFPVQWFAPQQFVDSDIGLARISAGLAFVYLFRRYGHPHYYGTKTVAGYYVETKTKGVCVDFAIKGETCWIYVTGDHEQYRRYVQEAMAAQGTDYSDFCEGVHTAVHNTLLDMLRPVKVDDSYINIFGDCKIEWDEEREEAKGLVNWKRLDEEGG